MIYCTDCKAEVDARIEKRTEAFDVRGESVEVNSRVAVCPACGSDLVDEELESRNFDLAYDAYRARHELLSPSQIAEIRQKYGLSQRALARLLGWGEITVHRYESGAIQDSAHETVLRLIAEPQNLKQVLEKNRDALPLDVAQSLSARLDSMVASADAKRWESHLGRLNSSGPPSVLNGSREYDSEKLEEAVLFFVSRVENAFKTKLNKLLWYADFVCYQATKQSITGSQYLAATHGPVPRNYDWILGEMIRKGLIRSTEVEFPTGSSGELLEACREPRMAVFSGVEQACMGKVVREFRHSSATEVRRRSHTETAYRSAFAEGTQWAVIPYSLADTLSLQP